MVLRYHTEYHIFEALGDAHFQVRVMGGHSLGSHIMTGQGVLTCMMVELLYGLLSSFAILEWEGMGRLNSRLLDDDRHHLVGLSLLHSSLDGG